jgi:hypothetical protein
MRHQRLCLVPRLEALTVNPAVRLMATANMAAIKTVVFLHTKREYESMHIIEVGGWLLFRSI